MTSGSAECQEMKARSIAKSKDKEPQRENIQTSTCEKILQSPRLNSYGPVCFFMVMVIHQCYLALIVLFPIKHPKWTAYAYFDAFLASYIIFQVLTNYLACITVDLSGLGDQCAFTYVKKKKKKKNKKKENNNNQCDTMQPQNDVAQMNIHDECRLCGVNHYIDRNHYCNLCEECVVKQLHHCFVIGRCLGQANQAIFLKIMVWISVAIIYSTLMQVHHLILVDVPPFGWTWFKQLLSIWRYHPVFVFIQWSFGYVEAHTAFMHASMFFSVTLVVGAMLFSAQQLYLTLRDQTEHQYGNNRYGPLTKASNSIKIEYVFGRNMVLSFLLPDKEFVVLLRTMINRCKRKIA